MPARSIGATANSRGRFLQTPMHTNSFVSPAPATRSRHFSPTNMYRNFATPQNPLRYKSTAAATPIPSFDASSHQRGHLIARPSALTINSDTYDVVPRPCFSLINRLSLSNSTNTILSMQRRSDMKSVDRTTRLFKKTFSGLLTESWIQHLDALELSMAKKHAWTAFEYYYGLRSTLAGKAMTALVQLETDQDRPDFRALIPDWYEPAQEEWRPLMNGTLLFSTTSERTRVAILIVYFHLRYQRSSGETAYNDFLCCTQDHSESLEEWGIKLDARVRDCQKFGKQIMWEEYLNKWLAGTANRGFVATLQDALIPNDPFKPPLVTDYNSFKTWYQHYRMKSLHSQRNLSRRSRLLNMSSWWRKQNGSKGQSKTKAGSSSSTSQRQPRAGAKREDLSTSSDSSRRGPAPAVTTNTHQRLFQKPKRDVKDIICYNCGQKGHYAKDCGG